MNSRQTVSYECKSLSQSPSNSDSIGAIHSFGSNKRCSNNGAYLDYKNTHGATTLDSNEDCPRCKNYYLRFSEMVLNDSPMVHILSKEFHSGRPCQSSLLQTFFKREEKLKRVMNAFKKKTLPKRWLETLGKFQKFNWEKYYKDAEKVWIQNNGHFIDVDSENRKCCSLKYVKEKRNRPSIISVCSKRKRSSSDDDIFTSKQEVQDDLSFFDEEFRNIFGPDFDLDIFEFSKQQLGISVDHKSLFNVENDFEDIATNFNESDSVDEFNSDAQNLSINENSNTSTISALSIPEDMECSDVGDSNTVERRDWRVDDNPPTDAHDNSCIITNSSQMSSNSDFEPLLWDRPQLFSEVSPGAQVLVLPNVQPVIVQGAKHSTSFPFVLSLPSKIFLNN